MCVLEADRVRDCLRCIPSMVPGASLSDNVKQSFVKTQQNGMRTFTYSIEIPRALKGDHSKINIERRKVMKYVYTCNLPALEEECNEFFVRIQKDVDLKLRPIEDKSDPGS